MRSSEKERAIEPHQNVSVPPCLVLLSLSLFPLSSLSSSSLQLTLMMIKGRPYSSNARDIAGKDKRKRRNERDLLSLLEKKGK